MTCDCMTVSKSNDDNIDELEEQEKKQQNQSPAISVT